MTGKSNRMMLPVLLCLPLLLTACGGGGSEVHTQQEIYTKTTGQELMDLKSALDAGALSKEEYEAQRKKILNRR